jgi:hypothetical protein
MPGLDAYTAGLVGFYSTRRAFTDHTTPLVRARRDSDGATTTVYPDADGKLSLTSPTGAQGGTPDLGTWAGAATVTAEWEDASPSARPLIQADPAKQPVIVQAGALVTEGGQPALKFDGAGDVLEWAASTTLGEYTLVARFAADSTDQSTDHIVSLWGQNGLTFRPDRGDPGSTTNGAEYPVSARDTVTTISVAVRATDRDWAQDGTVYNTSPHGPMTDSRALHVGGFQGGGYSSGARLLEIAIWDHAKSPADVAAIAADQGASTAVPPPVQHAYDTFTEAASVDLISHTSDLGHAWTTPTGAGEPQVEGGAGYVRASKTVKQTGVRAIYQAPIPTDTYTVRALIEHVGPDEWSGLGLIVRSDSAWTTGPTISYSRKSTANPDVIEVEGTTANTTWANPWPGGIRELRAEVRPDSFDVWFDDVLVIEVTDASGVTGAGGYAGLVLMDFRSAGAIGSETWRCHEFEVTYAESGPAPAPSYKTTAISGGVARPVYALSGGVWSPVKSLNAGTWT